MGRSLLFMPESSEILSLQSLSTRGLYSIQLLSGASMIPKNLNLDSQLGVPLRLTPLCCGPHPGSPLRP